MKVPSIVILNDNSQPLQVTLTQSQLESNSIDVVTALLMVVAQVIVESRCVCVRDSLIRIL